MTLSPKTQLVLTWSIMLVTIVGTIGAMTLYWLPRLTTAHSSLHANEAAIAAIQRQQDNLTGLSQQLAERTTEQGRLNKEMWGFLQEDAFFERWDTLGSASKTTIKLESISDASPAPNPIEREVILLVTGTLPNILQSLDEIAAISPIVVVREIRFDAGTTPTESIARITAVTLWYDDSHL